VRVRNEHKNACCLIFPLSFTNNAFSSCKFICIRQSLTICLKCKEGTVTPARAINPHPNKNSMLDNPTSCWNTVIWSSVFETACSVLISKILEMPSASVFGFRQVYFKWPLDLFVALARSYWIATLLWKWREKYANYCQNIYINTLISTEKLYSFYTAFKTTNLTIKYRLLSPINELVDVIGRIMLSTILGCN
jgi:hypothetical protein